MELLSEHLRQVPVVTATSMLCSGLTATIDDVQDQTAAGPAAAGASFRESLSGPAASAALIGNGAVVATERPVAFGRQRLLGDLLTEYRLTRCRPVEACCAEPRRERHWPRRD